MTHLSRAIRHSLGTSADLAAQLTLHQRAIRRRWTLALKEVPGDHYARLSLTDLSAWTDRGLNAVIHSLTTGSPEALERHACEVSWARHQLGFGIGEVSDGIMSLADAARPFITNDDQTMKSSRVADLSSCIRTMIVSFVHSYEESARATVEHNLNESRSLEQMTSALLERKDLPGMLALVCRESRRLTGASGSAVLLFDGHGSGANTIIQDCDEAAAADLFLSEALQSDSSLVPVEPIILNDAAAEIVVSAKSDVRTLAAVPLRIHGGVLGVLRLVNKEIGFSENDLRILSRIADQAVIAIEHARLHDQQERMAVLRERQRLARDLHDSVSQSIYGVTMFAEAAARLLETGDVEAATEHLSEIRGIASKALWEMRLLVFELNPVDVLDGGLLAALQARLAAVEQRAGLETDFDCDQLDNLPPEIEQGLYGVAQEAINNAIRHANANKISLRVTCLESAVQLVLADDGEGFDLAEGRQKGGLGLRGMEERV